MGIGSISGSGDSGYEIKRRQLEEERSRELDRLERQHQEQIERAREAKEKSIEEIYAHQSSEVEDQRQAADRKVAQAKADADERIRSFEDDSRRMTDEARRQFQNKADLLAKTSHDLEQQRTYMLKQHSDQMKKLKEQREEVQEDNNRKLQLEMLKVQQDKAKTRDEMQLKANAEIDMLEDDLRDRKYRTAAEGEAKIAGMQANREQTLNDIQNQIAFAQRTGASQMEHERAQLDALKDKQQLEFEERMSELQRRSRQDLNRAQSKGRETVAQVKEFYDQQIEELRKGHAKKMNDMTLKASLQQTHLENEAKIQDQIVLQNLRDRRTRLTEENRTLVAGHAERNEQLRRRLNDDYKEKARTLANERQNSLASQEKAINAEIEYQRLKGQNQLDDVARANALKVSSAETKASDPFYRLRDIGASLNQAPSEYVIELRVPEHEQDTFRVTQQTGALTLSGTRRSEMVVKGEDGGKASTHSYQSYTQSFPITGTPVMGQMSREYADGTLRIRIPRV